MKGIYRGAVALAAAMAALGNDLIAVSSGPQMSLHRRGRFKRNARRQKGRKTLPRKRP